MKKQLFIAIIIAMFSSAGIGQVRKVAKVGIDKDVSGCIASAGYSYSKLKKDCIRVFEQKIQLYEVAPTATYSSIVAVIFSDDKATVELFIPKEKESVILKRTGKKGNYIWKNNVYAFTGITKYVLKKGDKIIFKS
jgi:hypothetical protein